MVNYQDPATIALQSVALVKFWHVVNGVFIWEYFTTFDFEWDVIRGRRPYRRTIWVYFIARLATLLAVILDMVGFDTTTPLNCQAWVTIDGIFSYSAYAASSMLIVLRVIAIWNKSKTIYAISMTIWFADLAALLYGAIQVRATWSPEGKACFVPNFRSTEPAAIGSLVTDLSLLLIMLLGLLRLRVVSGGVLSMGRFLWKQGLIWLLIATVVEVPPVILLILNLNVPLDIMFQIPCLVMVTIAATRMFRSLAKFNSSDVSHHTPKGTVPAVHSGPIPLERMEVTVHTEFEQYGAQLTRCGADAQGHYKVKKVSLSGDEESGLEK